MQQQAHIIAQRLLNLYRQAHVINGGWAAVNQVLLNESSDPQVIAELETLPTGKRLIEHINNLRNGTTPINSINSDLLPYGGMMTAMETNVTLTQSELDQLKYALNDFEPNQESLNRIKKLPFVQKFGNDWTEDIKSAIAFDTQTLAKWDNVVRTAHAYQAWDSATQLLSETLTERNRAEIQANMLEFETYLPMFGESGNELLTKLRTFMSSLS